MSPTRWIVVAALLAALGFILVRRGEAQENRIPDAQVEPQKWRITFTPNLWVAGLDGRIGLNGDVSDVSLGWGDVIDQFDIGVMGLLEARRSPWVLRTDLFYVNLGDEVEGVTIDQEEFILQPEVGRTVVARPWGGVDVLAGVRYWHLNVDVTAPPSALSGSKEWLDATVGAAWRFQPGQHWHLFAKGDLGGGGSKFTWQGYGGAGYDVSHCCAISALYRYLDVDYEKDDDFVYDVHLDGPALGLTVRF